MVYYLSRSQDRRDHPKGGIVIRLEDFNYLLEISKCRSMREASEKLFVSPQALGLAVRRLEREVGFQVITRSYCGVSLTRQGKMLLNLYRDLLPESEKSRKMKRRPKSACSRSCRPMSTLSCRSGSDRA